MAKRKMTTMDIPMALPGVLPPEARGQGGAQQAMLSAGAKDLQRSIGGTRRRRRPQARELGARSSGPGSSPQGAAIQNRLAVLAGGRTRV